MYNVYGVWAETYTEACLIAGCDTPDQLRAEAEYLDRIAFAEEMETDVLGGLNSPVTCHYCPEPKGLIGPVNAPLWEEHGIPF